MTKRRVANNLMFGGKRGLKYPVNIVMAVSGTGTATKGGVVTVVSATASNSFQINTGGTVYCTLTAGTNIGTKIGTAGAIGTY